MTLYWTPGNRDDALLAIAVVVFTALELRYNFWKRITNRIGDFFGRPLPTGYVLALPFLIWFWLSLVFFVHYNENILLVRAFNLGSELGTGHIFVWMVLAMIATRWGFKNIVAGFDILGMFGALHEIIWYAFYGAVYGYTDTYYYLPFIFLGITLLGAYAFLSRNGSIPTIDRRTIILMIVFFVVMDAMWAIAGFPVPVSLSSGNTPLFLNLQTNLIESESWVIPAIPLIMAKPEVITRPISWLKGWVKK